MPLAPCQDLERELPVGAIVNMAVCREMEGNSHKQVKQRGMTPID